MPFLGEMRRGRGDKAGKKINLFDDLVMGVFKVIGVIGYDAFYALEAPDPIKMALGDQFLQIGFFGGTQPPMALHPLGGDDAKLGCNIQGNNQIKGGEAVMKMGLWAVKLLPNLRLGRVFTQQMRDIS